MYSAHYGSLLDYVVWDGPVFWVIEWCAIASHRFHCAYLARWAERIAYYVVYSYGGSETTPRIDHT